MGKYRDQYECFKSLGIFRSNAVQWRAVRETIVGEVNGFPKSHGVLVATDGILCLIETESYGFFEGHLEWFKTHRPEYQVAVDEYKRTKQAVDLETKKRLEAEAQVLIDSLLND